MVASREVHAIVRIGAETNGPAQGFLESGLEEISSDRRRVEKENKVIVVRKEVKTSIGRKEPMHAVHSDHGRVGLFSDRRPTEFRATETFRQESKRLVSLILHG